LTLKENARVMFVKNNPEKGYFNGSLGTVTSITEDKKYPKVKLDNGAVLTVKHEEWMVTDENDNVLASYNQVPLRLAWAITIHKSQGMTLDCAEIDLSKTFERGQGYVALSRLKSIEGLKLVGLNSTALEVDDLAFKADKRFQELSDQNEFKLQALEKEQLAIDQLDFIDQCGGTNDEQAITQNKNRVKVITYGGKKVTTHERTRKLLSSGKTIAEIAYERDLTEGTIISHIEKIKEEEPSVDLEKLKPDRHLISKVEKVVEKLREQNNEEFLDTSGNVKLSYIHRALNGKMDYEDIRLCRLFIE